MLENLLLSVLGIVLMTLLKALPHLKNFDGSKFLWDNLSSWLWSILFCFCIVLIAEYDPESIDQVLALAGIEIDIDKGIPFIPLGMLVGTLSKIGVRIKDQA